MNDQLIIVNPYNQNARNNQNSLQIITGRVVDIILDEKHPEFKNWDSIGKIFFTEADKIVTNYDIKNLPSAKPLHSYKKYYPLKSEIVYIVSFVNFDAQKNISYNDYYYVDVLNIWSHPQQNALPPTNNDDDKIKKDYNSNAQGDLKQQKSNSSIIDLGDFEENPSLKPLLPNIGDLIFESRFGSSIRFGKNQTIIRSGQFIGKEKEGWLPNIEDINNDLNSIYFSNTGSIPLDVASKNLRSFNISLSKPQIQGKIIKSEYEIKNPSQTNKLDTPITSSNTNQYFTSSISQSVNFNRNVKDDFIIEDGFNENPMELDNLAISDNLSGIENENNIGELDNSKYIVYWKVPYQSQNWSSDTNMRKFGCAATVCAMLITFVKKTNYSKEKIVSINGGLSINFSSLSSKVGLKYRELNSYNNLVEEVKKQPVIILVNSLSNPLNASKQHFVVGIGVNNQNQIIIHDPVFKYGANTILGLTRYNYISPKAKIRIFY